MNSANSTLALLHPTCLPACAPPAIRRPPIILPIRGGLPARPLPVRPLLPRRKKNSIPKESCSGTNSGPQRTKGQTCNTMQTAQGNSALEKIVLRDCEFRGNSITAHCTLKSQPVGNNHNHPFSSIFNYSPITTQHWATRPCHAVEKSITRCGNAFMRCRS